MKTISVGLSSHLHHTNWSNAADGSGTALVSASASQIGIDRAFCFQEGEDVGVEQGVLFPVIALQKVPGDSSPPIPAVTLQ